MLRERRKEKIVAIIPARQGSKRVKNKNMRHLDGEPLICHTIKIALSAVKRGIIERVIVSTDSAKIGDLSLEYGAEVPFLRPKYLAKGKTPDWPVFQHLIKYLGNKEKYQFNILLNLRPTSPFRSLKDIQEACSLMKRKWKNIDAVRSVTRVKGVHHPFWMFKRTKNGKGKSFIKRINISKYYQSQLLPDCFRLNGSIEIMKVSNIIKGNLYGKRIFLFELPEERSLDIDTQFDLKIAEGLIKA
jgi:N-acylneuraminate cytidylyltransferase/CMP-N,N'-diacetyllegionaminic acid synthase